MADKLYEYSLGNKIINLYEVLSFEKIDNSLLVHTTSKTLYFNNPIDLDDLDEALENLTDAYNELRDIIQSERVEPIDRQDQNFLDLIEALALSAKEIKDGFKLLDLRLDTENQQLMVANANNTVALFTAMDVNTAKLVTAINNSD